MHARRPELSDEDAGRIASLLILRYGAGLFWRDAETGETQGRITHKQFEAVAGEL